MDLFNFIIYISYTACQKVGQHALYMLNSVIFANLYSSHGKGLQKYSLKEEQTFFFNFFEDIQFFAPSRKRTIYFKKNPSPPEYQMVRPL